MEIPVIGKFFKKIAPVPDAPRPVQMERMRPKINKELVKKALAKSLDRDLLAFARRTSAEPTEKVLEDLIREEREGPADRKFVRGGDRIIIGEGTHPAIAQVSGMQDVDDAGFIEQREVGQRSLFVRGGSQGFGISQGNENRPATIDLLRKLMPTFTFEEKLSEHNTPL